MNREQTRLTSEQKRALCDHRAAHQEKTLAVIGDWAATTFKLRRTPASPTLPVLFQERSNRAIDDGTANPSHKTTHKVHSPEMEEELLRWIGRCEARQLPIVTGAAIREKAARLRDKRLGDSRSSVLAMDKLAALSFSKSWLYKFQLCHRLTSKKTQREAASVSITSVNIGREELRKITNDYEKQNVLNMDETAYFYCTASERTIARKGISGRKNVKKRFTVVVTSNADGSTRTPLFFIGTAQRPRCFGRNFASDLGLHYESAPKGWMTTSVFVRWAEHFNEKMRSQDRHVLLLLDNASSHKVTQPLPNVTIKMLPPNTTPFHQPQDAGVIRSFKAHIERQQIRHAVDKFDEILERSGHEDKEKIERYTDKVFHVDVLTAMRWAQDAWAEVASTTIANCWRHTGIVSDDMLELQEELEKLKLN